jgi:N-acetylmuramoyl-L-alanine amidase
LNYKPISRVDFIAIHCTATREGQNFKAADIDRWHRAKGWLKIGYHYVIDLDGNVEKGRPDDMPGAHVEGYNSRSLGIVYVGGLADDGKTPKDTRTPAQIAALTKLVRELHAKHPNAVIQGHRDFPKVAKACPSFDVKGWLHTINL